jgi:hypothetical protein
VKRWHPTLTLEKWAAFPPEARLNMVRNELSRARNSQAAGYYGGTKLALERALELLDLTVETSVGSTGLRDLLRWRERIARAWLFPEDLIPEELVRGPDGPETPEGSSPRR